MDGSLKVRELVRGFCERILPKPQFLISLCRRVNMEVVEPYTFQYIRVFMALAIITPKSEDLSRTRDQIGKDNREIEGIKKTLSQNEPELGALFSSDVELTLLMPPFGFSSDQLLIVRLQLLGLFQELSNFGIREERCHKVWVSYRVFTYICSSCLQYSTHFFISAMVSRPLISSPYSYSMLAGIFQ